MTAPPQSYQDWVIALLGLGCSVDVDATKITAPDAERIASQASRAPHEARVTFYNCGTIPFDLRPVASLGRGRVAFRF